MHSTNLQDLQFLTVGLPKKLSVPGEWNFSYCDASDLKDRLAGLIAPPGRVLILAPTSLTTELSSQLTGLSAVDQKKIGILWVTKPTDFVAHQALLAGFFVDFAPEKDFAKHAEYYILRTLRHWNLPEEKAKSKVNQAVLEKLHRIFIDLSAERDVNRLLASIVEKATELSEAHQSQLYLVQEIDGELCFTARYSNQEKKLEPSNLRVQEGSLCGYVVLTGKSVQSDASSRVRALTLPQRSDEVDLPDFEKTPYLFTLPLRNSRNEVSAVLQLGSSKENFIESEDESVLTTLATQAAICMENVGLYEDIQKLFQGFVKASISAIEARDPSTGGHSERVALMTVGLARATTEVDTGIYRSVRFRDDEIRELEYAALLHDFGKIGIREEVLMKAKKLYPYQLQAIEDRLQVCIAAARISILEKRIAGHVSAESLEKAYQARVKQLHEYWQIILASNEPTILPKKSAEILSQIRSEKIALQDGIVINLLTEAEYQALSVNKGSLTSAERLEVESHVRHTYQFLKMIPWTKDFKHLTEIAYAHHEKLDGSGYPRGLTAHEIPLQSKIMTIADIYDALTASDRWYKEAVPAQKALDILRDEVNQGKLDPILFEIFVSRKIYELTHPDKFNRVA